MKDRALYDVVIYGATGFTGRLVCEYLAQRGKEIDNFRWAMAGRSLFRLEQVRDEIGAGDVPLLIADADDPASIAKMAADTRLVLTTVGPYQLYGEPLVAACAKAGTDYVDLSGEPNWMRAMIDTYEATARQSGARILFSCGFDSIPSELGVWYSQQRAMEKFGKPLPRIRARVRTFIGGPSGGSVAAGMTMMKAAQADPAFARLLQDPFALTPGFQGPQQPTGQEVGVEPDVGPVKPFILGATDAKNVHRSNFVMGHPYGTDFVYDEMLVGEPTQDAPPSPASLPKPGEGPSAEMRAAGRFDMLFIGSDSDGREVRAAVKGTRDPGYGTTSRMITETALCLLEAKDVAPSIWTPGAALQQRLLDRLCERAHMSFELESAIS